ncbi:hypothetical protein D9619_010945 [Psilocybe cf. subviscida]|uniref:Thiol methyltransferase 1 n=1 Tax=Psilocybe cf. subviscida TaxID=2480587 RepID=A0A8H5B8W1_9AGAR|nr:hypothetical protein D9619_010945 [Psilocybe cf. subviscida]
MTSDAGLQPKDIVKHDDLTTWELAWTKGVTPWDAGDVQPSLREAIEASGIEFPKSGRALVPGCGSGYDMPYISSQLGFEAIGLDVAETAIKNANESIRKAKENHPNISASIETMDFFKYDPPADKLFDLIYDHTFFVAIPPYMRGDWGRQMGKLVKPGGVLITVAFPLRPFDETGPPYYVLPEHYDAPLGEHFDKVVDKVPDKSSASHEGKERLLIWKRK